MAEPKTSTAIEVSVRISGALLEHVERAVSCGEYESPSEYLRDLIRRDEASRDDRAYETVCDELQAAFAEPDSEFVELSIDDIKALAAERLRK